MKHDLAKTTSLLLLYHTEFEENPKEYSIDVPGPDVPVDTEDALGNTPGIHKGPDTEDALGNIPNKFLSSETKITYFNQIKEAQNLII